MNHLSDEFTHSTVNSEAAKDSPTVQLVRYLIDAVHSQGSNGAEAVASAQAWLAVADADLIGDGDEQDQPLLADAAPLIAALTARMSLPLSLHSLVINWNDRDSEEGTFGTTVRAWGHDHAEYQARAQMEVLEYRGSYFDGEVVDHNVGASWRADDLERSLRGMVKAMSLLLKVRGGDPHADAEVRIARAEIDKANALLVELDNLA